MPNKREKALFVLHRFVSAYESGSREVFQDFMNNQELIKETIQAWKDYLEWASRDDSAVEEMKKGVRLVTVNQPLGKSGSASRMFFKLAGAAALTGGIYYALARKRKKETAEK